MVPLERTSLGRLRADEAYMARRLANISNFGSGWLKPPGVAKTLAQMRDEKREAEEHAEAMRREQLAADLVEAEAEAALAAEREAAGGAMARGLPGEEMSVGAMMEGLTGAGMAGMAGMVRDEEEEDQEEEEEIDLDDEIPDADEASGLGGYDYDDDSDEEEESDEEESSEDEEDISRGVMALHVPAARVPAHRQRELEAEAERLRRGREAELRQMIALGASESIDDDDPYGVDGEEDVGEDTQGEILEEDDLLPDRRSQLLDDDGADMDMGMGANLDDDIPEAESGVYEHTDSDAELSSDDDDDGPSALGNTSFGGARRGQKSVPRSQQYRNSHAGPSDVTGRQSLSIVDISSILSQDESSIMGSSPQIRRRN
jgi:hypothetical protein